MPHNGYFASRLVKGGDIRTHALNCVGLNPTTNNISQIDIYQRNWPLEHLQCIKAKMLKWTGNETHAWRSDMVIHAFQPGMPHDWTM